MSKMDVVQKEYAHDEKLRKEDVQLIIDWLQSQPHLPKLKEQEVIWFLRSCYLSNEFAKTTIDTHFTMKTMSPEILGNKDVRAKSFQDMMDVLTFSILPEKTSDGDSIVFFSFNDPNPEKFVYNDAVKLFDMAIALDLYINGSQDGLRCCFDMKDMSLGHITKLGIMSVKKFVYYLQEGMPIRLKGLHFFNVTSIVDKLLKIMKPFMKKEVIDMLHLHPNVQDMAKFVPIDYLPSEYGGKYVSTAVLKAQMKENLIANAEFFDYQNTQLVDETKRPGSPKNASDIFGVEGTFKKLDID